MTMSTLIQYPTSCHVPARASAPTQGDEATSSLLNFVDMASSNIKLALDKPIKSKRKVNHRKYLQKQLKRCNSTVKKEINNKDKDSVFSDPDSPSGSTSVPLATPETSGHLQVGTKSARKENVQAGLQNKSLAALFDPRTLHERCCADPAPRAGGCKVPLRKRNLPASFFTEPVSPQLSRDRTQHLAEFHPGVYSSGQQPLEDYIQTASSCRHAGGGCRHAAHDSVDQMLHGQVENQDLNDILTEAWEDEGRDSSNTTPCSMTSSVGGIGGPADILETALTGTVVGAAGRGRGRLVPGGGNMSSGSPVSTPASGPVTSWPSVYHSAPSPTVACAASMARGGILAQPSAGENTPVPDSYPPHLHHIDTPTDGQSVIRRLRPDHHQHSQHHQNMFNNRLDHSQQPELHIHHQQNVHRHHDKHHQHVPSLPMQASSSPTHLASPTGSSSPTSPFQSHHQPLHIQTSITAADIYPKMGSQSHPHHHHHPQSSSAMPVVMDAYQSNKLNSFDGFPSQVAMNMNSLPVSIPGSLENHTSCYPYHDTSTSAMTNFWQGAAVYGQLQSCYTYL